MTNTASIIALALFVGWNASCADHSAGNDTPARDSGSAAEDAAKVSADATPGDQQPAPGQPDAAANDSATVATDAGIDAPTSVVADAGTDGATDAGAIPGDSGTQPAPECKRGVAYGHHSVADLTALRPGVHWWYNWSPSPESAVASAYAGLGVQFVPMVWGGSFDVATVKGQIPADAHYLLGFNEPNFFSQANLSAADAAARWPDLEGVADALGLLLTSPAVNYCGGGCHETDPFVYLDAFFAACTGCRVDYIAAHWYACDGPALTWYLGQLKKYGKPIWLTEFSCGDGADRSLAKQKSYMTDAVAILEADPDVFRYAWFSGRTTAIPNVDLLGEDGKLTELGDLYLSLPHSDPACAR